MPRNRGFGTISFALLVLVGLAPAAAAQTVGVSAGVPQTVSVIPPPSEPDPDPVEVDPNQDNVVTPGSADSQIRDIRFNYDVTVTFPSTPVVMTGPGGSELETEILCAYEVSAGNWSAPAECGSVNWGEGIFDIDNEGRTVRIAIGYSILAVHASVVPAGTYEAVVSVSVAAR
jgi:hypothetical protein